MNMLLTFLKILKKTPFSLVISTLLIFLSCVLIYTYLTYSKATLEEIIFVLQAPKGKFNAAQLSPLLLNFLLPFLVLQIFILIIYKQTKKTSINFNKLITIVLSFFIFISTVGFFVYHYDVAETISYQYLTSDFIKNHYVEPNSSNITPPQKKKNLIHIYVESMEMSFASTDAGGGKRENVIPELTTLGLENETFSGNKSTLNGGHPLFGSTWTMGGAFSFETGLPLKVPMKLENSMETQDFFFKKVTTLGDILYQNGYTNVVMKDLDMFFAGSKNYYQQHGHYTVKDYHYFEKNGYIPNGYFVWWGFEDYRLFEIAKKQLLELAKSDKPFNLTFFTNDTHFEDGYICPKCQNDYQDPYSNVYRCSSRQVLDFVNWCKKQDFYKDTVIIISGDHLTMDSDYCDDLSKDFDRRTYINVINSGLKKQIDKDRVYSTFDLFPTTLSALGFKIKGGRLGLGVDLFSEQKTLIEQYGIKKVNDELTKKSPFMKKLANIHCVFNAKYDHINEFLKDLAEKNKNHDLLVLISQSGSSKGIFNEDSIKIAQSIGLSSLVTKISLKDDICNYQAVITRDKTKDQHKCGTILSNMKISGHTVYSVSTLEPQVKKNIGISILDDKYYTELTDGINIIVYNLSLKQIDNVYNFAPVDEK